MKKLLLSIILVWLYSWNVKAQNTLPFINSPQYDQMKQQGTLPQGVQFPVGPVIAAPTSNHSSLQLQQPDSQNRAPIGGSNRMPNPVSWCSCLVPIDASFSVVPTAGYTAPDYRNDDGSTAAIPLPFTFCLYGTNYNSVYINNNGNLSFGSAYGTFSSVGFPSTQYVMVAPFWADVDTRIPSTN